MRVELRLSKREAQALLRAELSSGHGVRRSQDLQRAEFKIREAVIRAQSGTAEMPAVGSPPATEEAA